MFNYQNKKILIVDDQKEFSVMLKAMISHQGAKSITFADSADSAIDCAHRDFFDVYFIDYHLGAGRNGIQLLDYLRNSNLILVSALCFIVTGNSNQDMVLSAIEKAPDDYLIKPFSPTQLLNRLTKATHKKDMLMGILNAIKDNNLTQAILLCHEKIKSTSKYSTLCQNILADIYIKTEQYSDAEKILKKLVNKRAVIQTSIRLGKTYYLQNKLNEAIAILEDIILHHPLQIKAYEWLARAYKKNNDHNRALSTLTAAANMTNHSIERHQEVALLAKEMHEYKIMLNSYYAILLLSRRSFYPDPCHLANYIHSIIDYARSKDELHHKKLILKKARSTLYQSRFEEGKNKGFDFDQFDFLCQAKIFFSLNKHLKAKRLILKTIHNCEKSVSDIDTTTLCESVLSLLDIGEFDDAAPYLKELNQRDIIDSTMQANLKEHTGNNLKVRINAFKTLNKEGINAFKKGDHSQALHCFHQALKREPLNSGSILNSIQVYLKLLLSAEKLQRKQQLQACQEKFNLLRHTHLSHHHRQRYNDLQKEFNIEKVN
ncbi:response regulator with TPR repeat [Psychromonas sp. CNPT3]|uniref:response regulator n=1 Tax=Psychromonas sp. CNPT3 TaxID=314282 RepID=UPI00006E3494|nr:response regulator [Psychromonas sp. CNPT3]AGH80593.1 response regulator with TPR repeat [Psychromonas sp. CNPT3]